MGGWQFATMIERGMRPMDTIRSATSVAAKHMGLSADVGSVAPGRVADLVAVRGNPLEDAEILRDVAVVMQAGVIVKAPAAE
jgi:imidazolonepropionase-like amidohydrolase